MIPQSLLNYIRDQLRKGFTEAQLRDYLLKYSYTKEQVDQAFSMLGPIKVHHEIHLSKTTLVVAVLFLILLSSGLYFFIFKGEEETLLDIELESVKTAVKPGEDIQFITKISNLGAKKRYDVKLTYEVIDSAEKRITYKQETKAVETSATSNVKITMPKNIGAGDYRIDATARYDGKTASASLPIEITAEKISEPSCSDGIKNSDEEGIDCGGKCKPCEKCPICDDSEKCTRDYCNAMTNFQCEHETIKDCCGNLDCESNEDIDNCPEDCRTENPMEGLSNWEKLDKAEEISKTNPEKAEQLCSEFTQQIFIDQCYLRIAGNNPEICARIEDSRSKNQCYEKVALAKNDPSICESIDKTSSKDTCYINFVIQKKNYNVCDKIFNEYLRQSCESLREMSRQNVGGAISYSEEELMKILQNNNETN